jgi:hypothetical protein
VNNSIDQSTTRKSGYDTSFQHPTDLCQEGATTLVFGLSPSLHPSRYPRPGYVPSSNAQGYPPTVAALWPLRHCKTFRANIHGHNQRREEIDQYLPLVRGTGEARLAQGSGKREAEAEEVEE